MDLSFLLEVPSSIPMGDEDGSAQTKSVRSGLSEGYFRDRRHIARDTSPLQACLITWLGPSKKSCASTNLFTLQISHGLICLQGDIHNYFIVFHSS